MRFVYLGSRFTLHASSPRSVALTQLRFACLAALDARLLAACATAPQSAIALADALHTNTSRIKRAARRLERIGHVRIVALPHPGQADVFGVEVCRA